MKNIFFLILFTIFFSCNKEDNEPIKNSVGYIVGFDPPSVQCYPRIGYLFISENLKDTMLTYNVSDDTKKMPANILLNSNDTIYQIPEVCFQNYKSSPYFPISERYKYKVEISYSLTKETGMENYICTNDILWLNYKNINVISIKKNNIV